MAYTKTKTPIVYYGGKTSIINHIMPLIPVHEVYTETFFGGGTVFFHKDPVKNETINDKLDLVINFYRTLRNHYPDLKRLVNATLISRRIHREVLDIILKHKRDKPSRTCKLYRVRLAWAFWLCTNFAYSNKIGGGYKYSNSMSVSVPDTLKKRKEQFTEEEAIKEGVDIGRVWGQGQIGGSHREGFIELWDSINIKRGSWESNPWVWVITFERINKES